jgi:thiol-disulfide isomerase/thioredoxin
MNKKALLVVLILTIIIAGGMTYVLLKKDKIPPETETHSQSSQPKQKAPTPVQKGEYTSYSADKLAEAKGTKLLFFHAPWCPQCRELDASIKASSLPDGFTIFKVDYDSHQALRAKYGVTIQTTIVKVDDAGNKIESYVAYDEPTFASVKKALLP